ncbi:uncharacterized protein CDAR_472451 [Caerostris darwini]|uniref:LRRCT domain-containing protein n=1 Tax=Caerostris darwini TaxID=1538125 RepID=A0AAV4VK79_9ARAC|nr:uncharacterized protein CDAR_472451 [Caerostris darwini]
MKEAFFIACIFAIAFSTVVLAKDLCPPPNLIQPCKCTSGYPPVTYECSNLTSQETMEKVFKKSLDYQVNALDIVNSIFMCVPVSPLNSKQVSILAINHCTMASLFESALAESNSLETVVVENSTFQRGIDWGLLQNVNLKMLQFRETDVKRIGESFRRMKPTLEQIEFKKTRTVSIHDQAFSRLDQLSSLVIVYNSLKTIKRSMFPSSLYFLDLTANKLTDLPDDIFTDMPVLHHVYLEKNQLQHFSSAVWEHLYDTGLQQVTLSDNPIICDCSVKWYTQKKRSVRVTGNCDTPENLHGWKLIQLSPGDFDYCRK